MAVMHNQSQNLRQTLFSIEQSKMMYDHNSHDTL